jgi:carbamoyltransferase
VYTGGHDLGACLVENGRIVAMIEEERLNRIKHGLPTAARDLWREFGERFGYFPWASVAYCLDTAGLGLDDLDMIVLAQDRLSPLASLNLPMRDQSKIVIADQPAGGMHHYAHALSAFYASPFDRAAVLVMDGDGTWTQEGYEAETGYVFERTGAHREIFKNRYTPRPSATEPRLLLHPGLGYAYEYASRLLGFWNAATEVADAGKTMGLAAYGGPNPALAEPWIQLDGHRLDFAPFFAWLAASGLESLLVAGAGPVLIGDERNIGGFAKDLAWKVQHELERAVVGLAEELVRRTGEQYLCLAGGVALNSVANQRLGESGRFQRIFVQPAAADNGQAIGLAYQGQIMLGSGPRIMPIPHAYGGNSYTDDQIAAYLARAELEVDRFSPEEVCARAAAELAAGSVIGWFQGGSEYGPRALGHRSILADPRSPTMRDHLNRQVKFREPFRPFAPSILAERLTDVFEVEPDGDVRFMLRCVPVRPEWRDRLPAIQHADGTGRVQTVALPWSAVFWRLISEFDRLTGVPLVLNTSFNLRGMPLVETPADALHCFVSTSLESLYLGSLRVRQPGVGQLRIRIARGWTLTHDPKTSACALSGGGPRPVVLSADERDLLAQCGAEIVLGAAGKAAGWPVDHPAIAPRLLGLARRGLRAGALEGWLGDVRLGEPWYFGRALPRMAPLPWPGKAR